MNDKEILESLDKSLGKLDSNIAAITLAIKRAQTVSVELMSIRNGIRDRHPSIQSMISNDGLIVSPAMHVPASDDDEPMGGMPPADSA